MYKFFLRKLVVSVHIGVLYVF